jgi:hypothetical protein
MGDSTKKKYVSQQLMSFCGNLPKIIRTAKKFVKKDVKRVKIPKFLSDRFHHSDSYRTIGSSM